MRAAIIGLIGFVAVVTPVNAEFDPSLFPAPHVPSEICSKAGTQCVQDCKGAFSCVAICKKELDACAPGKSDYTMPAFINLRNMEEKAARDALKAADTKQRSGVESPLPVEPVTKIAWEKNAIEKAMRASSPPGANCRRENEQIFSCKFKHGTANLEYKYGLAPDGSWQVEATGWAQAAGEFVPYRRYMISLLRRLTGGDSGEIDRCYVASFQALGKDTAPETYVREMQFNDRILLCNILLDKNSIIGINARVR